MKQLMLTIILSSIMITCKGQGKKDSRISNNSTKTDTMEYFNENKYKEWELQKISTSTNKYYKRENTWVRIIFSNGEYTEEISQIDSPYKVYKYYYKNRVLKKSIKEFDNFPIEITKEYDKNGKLIKETDHDKNYPFKVEDLCKLIKEEYGIDLMKKPDPNKDELQYRVDKRYESSIQQHLYFVVFSYGYADEGEGGYPVKAVYVNGTNGKVLYEDAQFLERPNGDKIPKSKTPFPQKNKVIKERKTSFIALPEEKGTYEKPQLGTAYTYQSELSEDKNIHQVYEGRYYTKAEWEEFQKSLPWWKKIF